MFANIVVQFFLEGGPVMWPILICALVAVAVVGERTFWWLREKGKRTRILFIVIKFMSMNQSTNDLVFSYGRR